MRTPAWLVAALAMAALAAPGVAQGPEAAGPGRLTVDFLEVGQGDAVLIRSPEGRTVLVDAGPSGDVVSLLKKRGVTSIDLAVVSHHHADHYGGMADVVRAFRPRLFLASHSPHTSEQYLRLVRLVLERGIRAITPAREPRRIELGSAVLTILPQPPHDPREENNNSIGLRLDHGRFSVLLTGDSEKDERRWWERTAPALCARATVLKLAHHGSRNGTDRRWLDLVRPRLAVASLGLDNDFGHPHRETLALLAARSIPVLRTDRGGTITVRSDGRHWQVYSQPHAGSDPPVADARGPLRTPRPRPPSALINVNTATEAELRSIPGIGPVLARRIIAGRPYHGVNQLGRVEGIGPRRLADIRPFVSVR